MNFTYHIWPWDSKYVVKDLQNNSHWFCLATDQNQHDLEFDILGIVNGYFWHSDYKVFIKFAHQNSTLFKDRYMLFNLRCLVWCSLDQTMIFELQISQSLHPLIDGFSNKLVNFFVGTAKRIPERLGIQTSSSFVKIW